MSRESRSANSKRTKVEREFVSEAEEILDRMREDCADLQDAVSSGEAPNPDSVNQLFRSAHTLKGVAGMFGFAMLGDLAHRSEDLLDSMRMGRRQLDPQGLEMLDDIVVAFAELVESIGEESFEERARVRVAELVARIEGREPESEAGAPEASIGDLDLDEGLVRALTEYEEHRLLESLRAGREIALVEVAFELSSFEDGLGEISGAIKEVGEVLSTLPTAGTGAQSQIGFSLLAALRISGAELAARLELDSQAVRVVREARASAEVPAPQASPRDPASAEQATPTDDVHPEAAPAAPALAETEDATPTEPQSNADLRSLKSLSDTVRVDIRKLDELMTLVGELSLQRGLLGRLTDELATRHDAALAREFGKVHHAFDRQLRDLQNAVLDVRMVPLRQVFEKLSRVHRRLVRDLGKDVRLEFSGADTELDKLIVEELIDPLMHIVRNAFDHAIEDADERSAKGKPEQGKIHVSAAQRGNHVVVQVRDDGRGIDPAALLERAVERGLVAADAQLAKQEILDLVFEPGFSTRDAVSTTSGRGVGMDVVRANLTSVGGIVGIESEPGEGTTISLTLPITLAIIQALLVESHEQRFAIPLNTVLETLLVRRSELQRSEGRSLLDLRGAPLLLQSLSATLGLSGPEGSELPDKFHVVVLGLGDLRLGLIVDGMHGQQDAVIKPIQGPMNQIHGIAGATELGDGVAVLVLDVPGIVEDSVRRREAA